VKEAIVTNSTCLIALERIDHLQVLPALFEPILVLKRGSPALGG